ncbi:MAG: PAS domain-containing protein [Butyricimonas faecihominis]
MSEYFSTSGTKLSAEMQEAILAATPNMMVIFDDSYHLVGLLNPILEHIPYPPEEMVGKTLEELIEEPESRKPLSRTTAKDERGKNSPIF